MATEEYLEKKNECSRMKIQALLSKLPWYCGEFARFMEAKSAPHTLELYLSDLRHFLTFIAEKKIGKAGEEQEERTDKIAGDNTDKDNTDRGNTESNKEDRDNTDRIDELRNIPLSDLENMGQETMEEFMRWLSSYTMDGKIFCCSGAGKRRKTVAVRNFLQFLIGDRYISASPAAHLALPQASPERAPRILEKGQADSMLAYIEEQWVKALDAAEEAEKEDPENVPQRIAVKPCLYRRDSALLSLLLETGIRISECVALNLTDIDIEEHEIFIRRNGGEVKVHIGQESWDRLTAYIFENRFRIQPNTINEDALFLSSKHCRMTVRAAEMKIREYSIGALGEEAALTPHDIRMTFGVRLAERGEDLSSVSAILGTCAETARNYRSVSASMAKG